MKIDDLVLALVFFIISFFAAFVAHYQIECVRLRYRLLQYQSEVETKVMQVLKEQGPCERISRHFKYIFKSSRKYEFLLKISKHSKCFERETFYLEALKAAFENKFDPTIPSFFVPLTMHNYSHLLPKLFNECCERSHYECVRKILKKNFKSSYQGQNIFHLAVKLDNINLAHLVKGEKVNLLHMRDSAGCTPLNYVRSDIFLEFFNERLENEEKKSPFSLEIQTCLLRAHFRICRSQKTGSWPFYIHSRQTPFLINVNRNFVFMDSYEISQNIGDNWYNPYFDRFDINFKNEFAIDESGVTNEWLSILLESFFTPNSEGIADKYTAPLFELIEEESNIYVPTNRYAPDVYKFAGSIVAIAAGRGIPMNVELIPSFYRVLFAIGPYRPDDLEAVSPQIHKNLKLLSQSTPEANTARKLLGLNRKKVNNFIQERTADVLYERYAEAVNAFAAGFKSKLRFSLVVNFDPFELKEWLKGDQALTFKKISEIILFRITDKFRVAKFLNVLSRFSLENLRKFLKFVTGRNALPMNGLAELGLKIIVIFHLAPRNRLPTSSTCFNHLHIYYFESEEELERQLLFAIENCQTLENR